MEKFKDLFTEKATVKDRKVADIIRLVAKNNGVLSTKDNFYKDKPKAGWAIEVVSDYSNSKIELFFVFGDGKKSNKAAVIYYHSGEAHYQGPQNSLDVDIKKYKVKGKDGDITNDEFKSFENTPNI